MKGESSSHTQDNSGRNTHALEENSVLGEVGLFESDQPQKCRSVCMGERPRCWNSALVLFQHCMVFLFSQKNRKGFPRPDLRFVLQSHASLSWSKKWAQANQFEFFLVPVPILCFHTGCTTRNLRVTKDKRVASTRKPETDSSWKAEKITKK